MEEYTLISGASSGIGAQIAVSLSASRNLILMGRNEARLNEVKKRCDNKHTHKILVADLSDCALAGGKIAEFIASETLGISGFVHSAGITVLGAAKAFDLPQITQMFNVNLFAGMVIMKTLLSSRTNKSGLKSAVFISSIAPRKAGRGYSFYAASKAALESYAKIAALECAPKCRINCVACGGLETPMTAAMFADESFLRAHKASSPLGLGETADIAAAAEFLLSEKSKWITGQTFVVDGGQSL